MKRTLELHLKTPEIELDYWMPADQDALTFSFQRGKLKGVISLNLDPEALDPEAVDYDYVEDVAGKWWKVPLSCSQVAVRIEGECDEMTDEEFLRATQALTAKYLNNVLSYIRTELGQYWVGLTRISEWSLNYFLSKANAKWIDEQGETEVLQGIDELCATPPISDFYYRSLALDKTRWESISRSIQEKPDLDLTKILMANAKQYLEDGDYRMAAVEAVTALDVQLPPFIRQRCKRRGISFNRFDNLNHKLYVGDYLKVLFPLVLDEQELDTWLRRQLTQLADSASPFTSPESNLTGQLIIQRCIDLNKVRNEAVHEGEMLKQPDDIQRGIKAVEWLLNFVRDVGGGGLPTNGMS